MRSTNTDDGLVRVAGNSNDPSIEALLVHPVRVAHATKVKDAALRFRGFKGSNPNHDSRRSEKA
jgi:hypothetical protein